MSSTIKRHRQSSSSSSSSTATGAPTSSSAGTRSDGTPKLQHHHPAKSFRIVSPTELSPDGSDADGRGPPILCTLPPTCTHRPTPLANTKELESHYATCHAHVCEQKGCGCVFPEARLLELHLTECHDPLAAVRKDRGERIFACHLVTCNRLFMTPKMRRLHLIQAHGYPKEYFFAVTNKGVGGLLRKWGEGASMIRKEWKSREQEQTKGKGEDVAMEEDRDKSEDDAEDAEDDGRRSSDDVIVYQKPSVSADVEDAADVLTRRMDALSLVPQSVRFGRGGGPGTRRSLGWRGRGRAGITRTRG